MAAPALAVRFVVLALVLAAPLAAQEPAASFRVRVTDAATSRPIPGAHVRFPDRFLFWITDANGAAAIDGVPPGDHRIEVAAEGYGTVEAALQFEAGAVAEADVALTVLGQAAVRGAFEVRPLATSPGAEAALLVRVADSVTGTPLSAAQVVLPSLDRAWITDDAGEVAIRGIPPGEQTVRVEVLGYATIEARVRFERGASAEADVRLAAHPISIEGVTVSVRSEPSRIARLESSGFYDRYGRGLGRQLSRLDIERRNYRQPSDIFRGMPGVRLRLSRRFGDFIPVGRTGCPFNAYVDGVRWLGAIDDLALDWIEGIEVYTGAAEIPAQYSGSSLGIPGAESGCGVILIWTR